MSTKKEDGTYYTDEQAAEALSKLAEHPAVGQASHYFFPEESPDFLKNVLKQIKTIDEFQILVMQRFVRWVLDHTAKNFSYDGISNIDPSKKFLALSNHRDIIMDPAITQLVLYTNGIPMTEIAVGDNLIHAPIYNQAKTRTSNGYDFSYAYENFADIISAPDVAILNQETIISKIEFD